MTLLPASSFKSQWHMAPCRRARRGRRHPSQRHPGKSGQLVASRNGQCCADVMYRYRLPACQPTDCNRAQPGAAQPCSAFADQCPSIIRPQVFDVEYLGVQGRR